MTTARLLVQMGKPEDAWVLYGAAKLSTTLESGSAIEQAFLVEERDLTAMLSTEVKDRETLCQMGAKMTVEAIIDFARNALEHFC